MSLKLKPVGNKLLLKLNQNSAERVVDGIVIPVGSNKETPSFGTVIAMGDKVDTGLFSLDQNVIFGKYSLTEISVSGEKFYLIPQDEVLGILQ